MSFRFVAALAAGLAAATSVISSQNPPAPPAPAEVVQAIEPPRNPLPAEEASAGVTQFSFIAYGDTRGRRDGKEIQHEHSLVVDSMLAAVKRLEQGEFPVRFVLQSGDAVVNGTDPRQWNASFVALINRLTRDGGVPYFLAPGNHDVTAAQSVDAPGRQPGLKNYLDAIARLIPPEGATRRLAGYPTYAFGYGNMFVIALDSNIAGDEPQFSWVKAQLESLDRRRYAHVVAFFHHPPFSSGPHGGATIEPQTAGIRAKYLPLFRQHRVRLTLTGHEHLYEHWVERYVDAAGASHRMDHVVTGGGGAPLYSYSGEPDLREYRKLGAAEKVALEHLVRPGPNPGDNPYHYTVFRVDGDQIDVEVIGVDWGRNFQPYRSNRAVLR